MAKKVYEKKQNGYSEKSGSASIEASISTDSGGVLTEITIRDTSTSTTLLHGKLDGVKELLALNDEGKLKLE